MQQKPSRVHEKKQEQKRRQQMKGRKRERPWWREVPAIHLQPSTTKTKLFRYIMHFCGVHSKILIARHNTNSLKLPTTIMYRQNYVYYLWWTTMKHDGPSIANQVHNISDKRVRGNKVWNWELTKSDGDCKDKHRRQR